MNLQPFEQVVSEHGPTVLRVCRAVLGPDDAEDAWSDTFLAALQAYPRLRPGSDVVGWLVTIAHRKAIDHVRAASRRAITLPALPDRPAPDDGHPSDRSGLWNALRALPMKQRQTVAYHYLAGVPYREIAVIVGGSEDAARRAAADGIAALRRHANQGSAPMTTDLFAELTTIDPDTTARLHGRLELAADTAGLLDIAYRTIDSPIGTLLLATTDQGMLRVAFEREGIDGVLDGLARDVSPRYLRAPARLDTVARELDEYFEGQRRTFDVPLDLRLSHGFRRTVLEHLGDIGYGHTASYGDVAAAAGNPRAARAVGSACRTNPLPLIVPCHRVVRSDGSIGQYLGGVAAKQLLLTMESAA